MENEARWRKKEEAIVNLANNISTLRLNTTKDINSDDERTRIVGTMIAVIDKTAERVGNRESESNGHFGVTGFKKKHITIEGNTVKLNYIGKSGVEQSKQFSDELVVQSLRDIIKNSPDDNVFTTESGVRVSNGAVNARLTDFGVTAKDLRGFAANNMVIQKLEGLEPEETEAKRTRQFNQVVNKVAAKIGHAPATLKKHYLLPNVQEEFVSSGKVSSIKLGSGGAIGVGGWGNPYLNLIFGNNA